MELFKCIRSAAFLCFLVVSAACCQPRQSIPVSESYISNQISSLYEVATVNTAGKLSIGSAIAVGNSTEDNKSYLYLLTAKHVVDEKDLANITVFGHVDAVTRMPTTKRSVGYIVTYMLPHPSLDIAFLKAEIPSGSPQHVDISTAVPYSMQRIYSMGLPMGTAPVVSEGSVCFYSEKDKYFATNTFVLFGCSGGGIFDRMTGKMIGVSVEVMMISMGPIQVPITHIHLFIPLSAVTDWLGERGLHGQ